MAKWPSGQVQENFRLNKPKVETPLLVLGRKKGKSKEEKREKQNVLFNTRGCWFKKEIKECESSIRWVERKERVFLLQRARESCRKEGAHFSAESKESCREPKRKKKLLLHLVSNHPPK